MRANGFLKGLIIGGIVGATASMMADNNHMVAKTRKRLMRRSSGIIGEVFNMIR